MTEVVVQSGTVQSNRKGLPPQFTGGRKAVFPQWKPSGSLLDGQEKSADAVNEALCWNGRGAFQVRKHNTLP